jgi:uncharacterized protein YodC (DUF2158 family)
MANSETIEAGDRVQLKSGGPEMTVAKELNNGQLHCQWFDRGELKAAAFVVHTLKKL